MMVTKDKLSNIKDNYAFVKKQFHTHTQPPTPTAPRPNTHTQSKQNSEQINTYPSA